MFFERKIFPCNECIMMDGPYPDDAVGRTMSPRRDKRCVVARNII